LLISDVSRKKNFEVRKKISGEYTFPKIIFFPLELILEFNGLNSFLRNLIIKIFKNNSQSHSDQHKEKTFLLMLSAFRNNQKLPNSGQI